jgi:50S ribosomal protein uL3
MNTNPGIIGKKLGMTQFFAEDGNVVRCTVIESDLTVLGKRTKAKDGYDALIVGLGERQLKHTSKPLAGQYGNDKLMMALEETEEQAKAAAATKAAKAATRAAAKAATVAKAAAKTAKKVAAEAAKAGAEKGGKDKAAAETEAKDKAEQAKAAKKLAEAKTAEAAAAQKAAEAKKAEAQPPAKPKLPSRVVRELRMAAEEVAKHEVGSRVDLGKVFEPGQFIDVQGTTRGRGFTGVMRRWNFAGSVQTHGSHEYKRHGGSIGTNMTPGRTLPGLKMPGHYGNETVSVLNLKVGRVVNDKSLLLVVGAVPGARNSIVTVRLAVKKRPDAHKRVVNGKSKNKEQAK